jgi:arabinoxylan arabinofuranohydrolase
MGKNPLFSDTYTADPAPLVHDCTFYITCGHDKGSNGFVLREWYVLSSTDLVNWTRKVALDLKAFSWADANAWAGQMVEKAGQVLLVRTGEPTRQRHGHRRRSRR